MFSPKFVALLSAVLSVGVNGASVPGQNVDVPVPNIGTYHGIRMDNVNLTQPVNAWLGVDFVKQPVGDLRFRLPQPLDKYKGKLEKNIIDATEYGLICPQNKVSGREGDWANWPMGEGCLNLNIYRPAGTSMKKKLPVALYIHAGGFNRGAARMYDGASFVASSQTPVIMVTINYRVAALGFLPSTETAKAGLLSLGLHDQVAALEWVNKNIGYFGGDKDQVTIFGLSSGAHSVGFHMLNYNKKVKPMFHRAIMSSGGPTSRAYPTAAWPLYEKQYLEFLEKVGCSPGAGVWDCLRSVDVETIRLKQLEIYQQYNWQITWPFQPVLEGPLIPKVPTKQWEAGNFYKVPVIVGNVRDEGSNYAPKNLSTNAEFRTFFKNLAPLLSEPSLDKIEELYPDPVTNPSSPYKNSPHSPQFQRLQVAYGDYAYICQAEETAVRASRYEKYGSKVWRYTFNQNNTFNAWQGIPHAGDIPFQADVRGTESRRVSRAYNSWLTSFVASGDPNKYALTKIDGKKVPYWPKYTEKQDNQIRMGPDGALAVEKHGYRKEKCAFWRSIWYELNH